MGPVENKYGSTNSAGFVFLSHKQTNNCMYEKQDFWPNVAKQHCT
jgi:methylmalonyl-CoA mutase N-terminal domain/subunit